MQESVKNTKRVAKNTLFLYFRMALVMLVSIYTSRIKLEYLGIENVGIYNVVGSLVMMFTFLNGSMTGATQRFLTYAIGKDDKKRIKVVFSTAINMHLLIAIIIFIAGETLGLWMVNCKMVIPEERMFAANVVYQLSLFSCMMSVINVPYNSAIVAYEKMSIYAYISVVDVLLGLGVIFTLPYITVDILIAYASMLAFISILKQLFFMWYVKHQFNDLEYVWGINKLLLKEMSGMVGWLTCGNFAFMLNNQGVNVLLNIFFGPIVNAARSIANQVQGSIKQFSNGFMMAMQPQLVKAYANNDFSYMHRLLFFASKISFLLMLFLSLPIFIEANFILNIWLVEVPEYTEAFLRIVLIQSLFEALSLPLIMSINATAQIRKFQIFESAFLLGVVPICYIILKAGVATPVIVYWVCFVVEAAALFMRIWLTLPKINLKFMDYFTKILFRMFLVLLICSVLCCILKSVLPVGWINFIIVGFVSSFSVLGLAYQVGLTVDERVVVRQKIVEFINSKFRHRKYNGKI